MSSPLSPTRPPTGAYPATSATGPQAVGSGGAGGTQAAGGGAAAGNPVKTVDPKLAAVECTVLRGVGKALDLMADLAYSLLPGEAGGAAAKALHGAATAVDKLAPCDQHGPTNQTGQTGAGKPVDKLPSDEFGEIDPGHRTDGPGPNSDERTLIKQQQERAPRDPNHDKRMEIIRNLKV